MRAASPTLPRSGTVFSVTLWQWPARSGHRPRKALTQVWICWEDSFEKEFWFRKPVVWMPPRSRTITMWGLISAAAESMAPPVQRVVGAVHEQDLLRRFGIDPLAEILHQLAAVPLAFVIVPGMGPAAGLVLHLIGQGGGDERPGNPVVVHAHAAQFAHGLGAVGHAAVDNPVGVHVIRRMRGPCFGILRRPVQLFQRPNGM